MMNSPTLPLVLPPSPRPQAGSPPPSPSTVDDSATGTALFTLTLEASLPVSIQVNPEAKLPFEAPTSSTADDATPEPPEATLLGWLQMLTAPSAAGLDGTAHPPGSIASTQGSTANATDLPALAAVMPPSAEPASVGVGLVALADTSGAQPIARTEETLPPLSSAPLPPTLLRPLGNADAEAPLLGGETTLRPAAYVPAAGAPANQGPMLAEAMAFALMERTEIRSERGEHDLPDGLPATRAGAAPTEPPRPLPQPPLQVVLPPGSAPHIDRAFHDGMAIRLQWMVQHNVGQAEIRLEPADLGPVEVRLEIDGKSVRADFHVATPEVRHLIESGLPRLRDLLEAQGLQLQHAGVGHEHGRQTSREMPSATPTLATNQAEAERPQAPASALRRGSGHGGLLSEYA